MSARPETSATLTLVSFDFCLVEIEPRGDWVEVNCPRHEWACGHHHRHWGPWVRCANRHQLEANE